MSDLLLKSQNNGLFDLEFKKGDLSLGKSLESSVLISLGSLARLKGKEFSGTLQNDGWWGEDTIDGDKWGSLLHSLFKRKNDSNLVLLAKQYVNDSLKWLVDDGVVSEIEDSVSCDEESLTIEAQLKKGESIEDYRYSLLWSEVF